MSTTKHERPGVYSSYDASTVVSGGGSGKTVGIAALSEAEAGGLHALARYEDAAAAFGAEDNLCRLAQTLFRNGAAQVKAAPVAADMAASAVLISAEQIWEISLEIFSETFSAAAEAPGVPDIMVPCAEPM